MTTNEATAAQINTAHAEAIVFGRAIEAGQRIPAIGKVVKAGRNSYRVEDLHTQQGKVFVHAVRVSGPRHLYGQPTAFALSEVNR